MESKQNTTCDENILQAKKKVLLQCRFFLSSIQSDRILSVSYFSLCQSTERMMSADER